MLLIQVRIQIDRNREPTEVSALIASTASFDDMNRSKNTAQATKETKITSANGMMDVGIVSE